MKINLLIKTYNNDFVQVDNYFFDEYSNGETVEIYSLLDNSKDDRVILGVYTKDDDIIKLLDELSNYVVEQTMLQRGFIDSKDCKLGQVFEMPKFNNLNLLN